MQDGPDAVPGAAASTQPAKSLRLEEKPQPRTKSDENDGSLSGLESSNPKTTSENSEAC